MEHLFQIYVKILIVVVQAIINIVVKMVVSKEQVVHLGWEKPCFYQFMGSGRTAIEHQ